MTLSQNGYAANMPELCSRRPIPGTKVGLTVRIGATGDLLLLFASLFDRFVQNIDQDDPKALDDWGYAARPIRGSTAISNHASGTAIDLNATRWNLGSPASVNLNKVQIDKVHEILAVTGGVIRWGADYTGRKDPMHFEINDHKSETQCRIAIEALNKRYNSSEDLIDMDATQAKQLAELHGKVVGLPLGLGGRPSKDVDDMYGHVLNADALGRQVLTALADIAKRLTALEAKVK